jgi:hypothetical protein
MASTASQQASGCLSRMVEEILTAYQRKLTLNAIFIVTSFATCSRFFKRF